MTVIILFLFFMLVAIVLINDEPEAMIVPLVILVASIFCSMNYRNSLIQYNNIDKEILIIQKNTKKLAKQINEIELKNATSISLGDSPYKATIESYTKMIDLLNNKEQKKVRYLKSIQFAESGFFRYTNKLFVNKEHFIAKD